MTHITCRLTAENRDQLRNPTLGNRVWATLNFLAYVSVSLSAMQLFCAKTAERIGILFGLEILGDTRHIVLDGGLHDEGQKEEI